jgi:transcriptional regulator with XRE-family HTH domain
MNKKLTLQEKLRDLRDERKLTLAELAKATGISKTTLHRLENRTKIKMGYQDVVTLTGFYRVSADYLFGLTDNRQHRGDGLDALYLSDEAISVLQSGDLNNRLLSEVIVHPVYVSEMGNTIWVNISKHGESRLKEEINKVLSNSDFPSEGLEIAIIDLSAFFARSADILQKIV